MALTTTQLQVIKALVTGSTIKDAAKAAGVHRSTVHDWTRVHREFREALDTARHHFAQMVEDELRSLAAASTAFLRKCIEDDTMPAALRLRAALAVVKSVAASGLPRREPGFADMVDAAIHAADNRVALNQAIAEASKTEPVPEPVIIPRSAPCPCGSGAKYKRCCGVTAPAKLGNDAIRQNPTRQPLVAEAGAGV